MTRLRPLSESECYTRLYGDREKTVSVIRESEPDRPQRGLLEEQFVNLFEVGMERPDGLPEVEAA